MDCFSWWLTDAEEVEPGCASALGSQETVPRCHIKHQTSQARNGHWERSERIRDPSYGTRIERGLQQDLPGCMYQIVQSIDKYFAFKLLLILLPGGG